MSVNAARLETLFNRCFATTCRTVLCGGADEPLYTPASAQGPARISYREDFVSSALHEVAHWCIAGRTRRRRVDYGYWYAPDGRSRAQQVAFERVEARPQALEWVFAQSCAAPFSLSLDNLAGDPDPAGYTRFARHVVHEAETFRAGCLPPRARQFYRALREGSPQGLPLEDMRFPAPDAARAAR